MIPQWLTRSPFGRSRKPRPVRMTEVAKLAVEITTQRRNEVKRVLFVDDDPVLGQLIAEWAPTLRVNVVLARSKAEVRKILETQSFDVAILDYRLLNGLSTPLYEEFVSRFPKTYVIFITGGSLDEVSASVHRIGPAPIFPKVDFANPAWLLNLLKQAGVLPVRP